MKIARCRLLATGRRSHLRSRVRLAPGVSSAQFGDELLLIGSAPSWRAIGERAADEWTDLQEHPVDVKPENLHLVVQIGDLFRQMHPDVPVVLSKGRYLVVDVDPSTVASLAAAGVCCYQIRPLPLDAVVFETRAPVAARSGPSAWIDELLGRMSLSNLRSNLAHLASLPTRHSLSSHYTRAASWARDQLDAMGYGTRLESVPVDGGTSTNIIADRAGTGAGTRELVVVVAHLDSVNVRGPQEAAPGADDNGSGSVGLLEVARALADHRGTRDLRFILFGGEEQNLLGSRQHLASLSAGDRARIRAVVNMDMIGTVNTASRSVLIEGATRSMAMIDGLAEAAGAYTNLVVQTSLNPFNSDHVSFLDAGVPAVLLIEGADNANTHVHTENDTLSHIDYELMRDILTMNVAYVANTLGRQEDARVSTRLMPPGDSAINLEHADKLLEALRSLPVQYSGSYKHNAGASARQGRGFVDRPSGQSTAALANPIYRLDGPVYVDSDEHRDASGRDGDNLRFALSIDIDGTDPLNVVSGTVAIGPMLTSTSSPHFIGRVTSDTLSVEGRVLVVEDFRFRWPEGVETITLLKIELSGPPLAKPTARVTFHDTVLNRAHGPFIVQQGSRYFREVEMDVDREANAVEVEPVSALIHPDRPTDTAAEELTLESSFAKAGIRITRSSDAPVPVEGAGANQRWDYSELHDSMQLHWEAYANKPQWKMWIFLAERADNDTLGGVMFDGEIDEPGGVDRQGTAIFTRCPYFHTVEGDYIKANPPAEEAVKRELFFNLMHETGHAFNLAHSFQKHLGGGWTPPGWMPLVSDNQALSWMNYPDQATPGPGAGANASWFYRRFPFKFDRDELLFLRHAPETYVQMGAAAWFDNHGRVARSSLDPRLELRLSSRKSIVEFGEPVIAELKLKNTSGQPVMVHRNLDPSDGLVELAVTNPRGERRPYLPFDHTRTIVAPHVLQPGGEALYQEIDLTMGSFGFPFKEAGAYRIEASYTNIDGRTAAAVMQLYVRPAPNFDTVPIVNELFNARIGRALYVEGTRVMEDVNDKLDWVCDRLSDVIGDKNPISVHLNTARVKPMASTGKVIDPVSNKIREVGEEPDRVVEKLEPVLAGRPETSADTMGHIWYRDTVDMYSSAAERTGAKGKARQAQEQMLSLFKARGVLTSVCEAVEARVGRLK